MWIDLNENNISGLLNFTQKFRMGAVDAEFKTGVYAETRDRSFNARNFGYAMGSDASTFAYSSLPVSEIFIPENINLSDGLKLKEITALSDSYDASSAVMAGYLNFRFKFSVAH